MLDCMIVGDSIAVGIGMVRKECVTYAKSGWSSNAWNRDYSEKALQQPAETVIISLGANDHAGINSELELRKVREKIQSKRVFWISPGMERKPRAQTAIEKIANEYGDIVLPRPKEHMSSDRVHPTFKGYKILGEQTK